MLSVMAKLSAILKSECEDTLKFLLLLCNHSSGFDVFSILASNNNDFKVTFMESLLINRDHPPLKKNWQLLRLELFDDRGT